MVEVWIGALEDVLRSYLGRDPVIRRGPHGKPLVDGLHFNRSHAGALEVVAVSDAPVGVDVERLRPGVDVLGFARRFLAAEEAEALAAVSEAKRDAAFLELWTAKEAYVKALGTGLTATPPRSFAIDGRQVVRTHDGAPASDWALAGLDLPAGYCGTLALRTR